MKYLLTSLLLLVMLGTAGPAGAKDMPLPPALEKLRAAGSQVDFIGHAYGVDGWRVVGTNGAPTYAYTTPEGGIVLGILMDPQGGNVTGAQLKALKGKLEGGQEAMPGAEKSAAVSVKAEKLYAEVEKSAWARTGDAKAPYLYMFVNTYCDHCQALWQDLEPQVKSGRLQVRIVPFGRADQNRTSGAALLSVDDAAAAWDAMLRGDDAALSKDKVKPGMLDRMDANTALFTSWELKGPPFVIYRRPSDGQITVVAGKPDNIMLILADLVKE